MLGLVIFTVILNILCVEGNVRSGFGSVEYVQLPLLQATSRNVQGGNGSGTVEEPRSAGLHFPTLLERLSSIHRNEEETLENTEEGGDVEGEEKEDDVDEDHFDEVDLIEFVQGLERQADVEEKTEMLPQILDMIHGKSPNLGRIENVTKKIPVDSSASAVHFGHVQKLEWVKNSTGNQTFEMSLNADGDLQLPSEDISPFSEDIVDGITAGIEESLRMSDDLELNEMNYTLGDNSSQTRQFSVYLFQGQYYAEQRLNRFIDGALRNMGTELRVASMDPLYFRVLPRGQVAEREQPLMSLGASGVRRRRPRPNGVGVVGRSHSITKRQMPAFFRPKKKIQQKKQIQHNQVTRVGANSGLLNRRRQQQRLQQRRRQQRIRQQKLKQQQQKKKQQQQQKKKQQQQKKQLLQRIRRRIRQDVGGGRIEGLSRVTRDGDAEMQLFGNYTLIRSHMKIGPLELTMQFRTKNGIRRSGATLPCVRAHTVTRVNHEGSEMIDYLLDRPHPEMIRVRGTMFPLAQKIAKNIFARLFLPNSFLVQKLREKAGLAYLSKPLERKR